MTLETIQTASGLWQQLKTKAGLELTRRGGKRGRDADVEDAVLHALKEIVPELHSFDSVEQFLAADAASGCPAVTVETLLVAVLTSQRGFAAMMTDILDLLVMADAQTPEHGLDVAFRFDQVSDPIRFTLEQFRISVEHVKKVLETRFELPTWQQLWDLHKEIRKISRPDFHGQPTFPPVPSPPKTGDVDLDRALRELLELTSDYQEWCKQFSENRVQAWKIACQKFPDHRNVTHDVIQRRANAATDYWDLQMIAAVRHISQDVRDGALDAQKTATHLANLFSTIESKQEWVERVYEELLDLLMLPMWRKRYELYSVWLGSILLRTAASRTGSIRFHPVNGVLSFAFGGSRLATYIWDDEQFDIWAELRSTLVGKSGKRKKGIQPDFRIVRASISESINASTHFVLESKHYLQASVTNFTQAANDYARSCPNAKVFIINHGPADQDPLTSATEQALTKQIRFIGDATPEIEAASRPVSQLIAQALFPGRGIEQPNSSDIESTTQEPSVACGMAGPVARIRLQWDEHLEDLDLSLEMWTDTGSQAGSISYSNKGDLQHPPYARLDQDVRHGPGQETIEVSAWHFNLYAIVVRNYSKTGYMLPEHVTCEVSIGKLHEVIECPPLSSSTEWHVASIVVKDGTPKLYPGQKQVKSGLC